MIINIITIVCSLITIGYVIAAKNTNKKTIADLIKEKNAAFEEGWVKGVEYGRCCMEIEQMVKNQNLS